MHTFLIIKFSIVVINLNNPSLLVDITSISVKKQKNKQKKAHNPSTSFPHTADSPKLFLVQTYRTYLAACCLSYPMAIPA